MAVRLLGVPTTLGLPQPGKQLGPQTLRSQGLIRTLERLGTRVEDLGDLPLPGLRPEATADRIRTVVETAHRQADFWLQRPGKEDLMLTLGGDHTTSLGTIWALHRMGHRYDLIWIDAHGDFNVLRTSPSGNIHGMVLALACGQMPHFVPRLIPSSILRLWGVRELDPGERLLLEQEQVPVHGPEQVRQDWSSLINSLQPDVYISFDMDAVDPPEAPGTMTPVAGGFTRTEALALVSQIARRRRLLALDLVELHPDRDREDRTAALAIAVARAAVDSSLPASCGDKAPVTG